MFSTPAQASVNMAKPVLEYIALGLAMKTCDITPAMKAEIDAILGDDLAVPAPNGGD
jgi:hypothetical protein